MYVYIEVAAPTIDDFIRFFVSVFVVLLFCCCLVCSSKKLLQLFKTRQMKPRNALNSLEVWPASSCRSEFDREYNCIYCRWICRAVNVTSFDNQPRSEINCPRALLWLRRRKSVAKSNLMYTDVFGWNLALSICHHANSTDRNLSSQMCVHFSLRNISNFIHFIRLIHTINAINELRARIYWIRLC